MNTSELSKKIKHGIKWQAIISIASQVFYFINGVILARILGPKEFGLYGMAQIVSSFVWMFWQLGLNAAIIQRKEIDRAHLDTAFTISIVMGIICAIITWFSAPFIAHFFKEPRVIPLTRVIAFTFVIYALDRIPGALLGRNLKFKEAAIPGLLNAIIYPAVAIPMALMGFGAMSFVWGVVAGAVVMLLVRYYWLFKYFDWRPRLYFEQKAAKDLLGFGVFLTLSNFVSFFVSNLQKIVTGRYLPAEDLGFYNRAYNLSMLPILKISSLMGNALLPSFSRIQDDVEKTRDWFRKFNFLTYAAVSPVLVFFMIFPDLFIGTVFGKKWLPAAPLLVITSIGTLIGVPVMYWSNAIMARGLSHLIFYMNVIKLPFIALFLFIGVRYGVLGVVWAMFLLRLLIGIPLAIYVVHKYIGITFKDYLVSFFEPILISFISGFFALLVLYLARDNFLNILDIFVLVIIGSVYCIIVFGYYFWRYNFRSYMSYLGFDLKFLMKV